MTRKAPATFHGPSRSTRRAVTLLRGRFGAMVVLALLLPAAVTAQNLLPNPGFDNNLSGWSPEPLEGRWSPGDAAGSPTSGSANYERTRAGGDGFLQTCINVAAGADYDLRAEVRVSPGDGEVGIYLFPHLAPDCVEPNGMLLAPVEATAAQSNGEWITVEGTYRARAEVASVLVELAVNGPAEVWVDDIELCAENTCRQPEPDLTSCVPGATTACLLDGRFEVTVDWVTPQGTFGVGRVMEFQGVRAESEESAFFWFFNEANFEMGVKMLDACNPFGNHWAFVSGLTNVSFELRIRDTETGVERAYANPLGRFPQSVGDIRAFACP